MASPRTRREGSLDQLASQGNGLSITIFLWAITWAFGFPALTRHPDKEIADFWPIFIMLASWYLDIAVTLQTLARLADLSLPFRFGIVIFVFLGIVSRNFRLVLRYLFQRGSWVNIKQHYHLGFTSKDSDSQLGDTMTTADLVQGTNDSAEEPDTR
jgi:hypothetical protein